MKITEVKKLIEESGGMLTAQRAAAMGVPLSLLSYLVGRGELQHPARGVYSLPETFDDEYFYAQSRFRKGVFSHACAAFLHGLTDRSPHELEMTFPRSYNTSQPRAEFIACHKVMPKFYESDVVDTKTPYGNSVNAYSPTRTVCDYFRLSKHPDDECLKILRKYLSAKTCNLTDLSRLMKSLRIEKTIRPYLESFTCLL